MTVPFRRYLKGPLKYCPSLGDQFGVRTFVHRQVIGLHFGTPGMTFVLVLPLHKKVLVFPAVCLSIA